ncbi:transmembrane protein, putative, partial [Bodo saltans]
GSSCEISNLCTNDDCSGHAIAVSGIRPSCTCTCPGEWIGAKCEIFNVCTSAVDCSNHAGRVVGNRPACTCYCLAAYHGKTCDVTYTLTPTATYSLELTSENSVIHTLTSSESTSGWNTKSVSGSASSSLSGSQSMSQQRRTTSFSFSLTMSTSLRTESQHVARSVSSTPSFSVSPKTDSGMPTSSPSHSPSRFVSNTSSFLVTSSVFASGNVTATPPSLSSSNSSSPTTTIPLSRPTCVAPSLTLSVPYVSSTATLSTSTTPLPCRALLEQTHARLYISLSLLTSPLIVLSNTSATSSYTMLVFQNQSLLNPQVNNVDAKGVVAVPVASIGIDRRTLINAGGTSGSPTIVANLTIHAAGQHATGLRIKNVRLNGNISLQHTYPYYGDSWHVVTLAPSPEYGWVSVSIWKTAAIILDVHMTCGADDAVRVHIVVPAPGIQQQLAAEVKAAALSSQLIALVAGGASSGAALGRLMATRSMVMCDADGAVGGGVLDLGIVPCSVEDNSNNFARSAVISDAVLVGIVGLVILLCGILLASVDPNDHNVFCTSTTIMLLPSSLLTVFVSVLPSIAASATLLAARLDASSCRAVDVVLVILAIVLTLTPIASLVLLYRHASINRWKCVVKQRSHDEISAAPNTKSHDSSWGLINTQFRSVLRQATRRRYAWQHDGSDKQTTIFQHSMVVLLEYRVLWYAVLDSSVLVAVGVLAVVGGLSHCTPIIALVMALLGAQLLLLIAARPYTTMFENIYSGTTLSLTLLSVAGQLVFASADSDGGVQDREWALTMSAVCDFVIVGVSLVKSMMDGYGVAMGARRRVLQAASVRRKASLLVVGQGKEVSIVVAQSGDDGNALNLEDVVMDEKHSVHNNEGGDQSMFAEIERQFWHSNGTARLDDNEFGMDDSDDTVL